MLLKIAAAIACATVLSGCQATADKPAQQTLEIDGTPREVAACVFENLDKRKACDRGLEIKNYENSGEARIICSLTATMITSATRDLYTVAFLPGASGKTTVKFRGHYTVPGVRSYADRVLPVVTKCNGARSVT